MKIMQSTDYSVTRKLVLFQLLYHCELMYDYLTETGKEVPAEISEHLAELSLKPSQLIMEYDKKKIKGELNSEHTFELQTKISGILKDDKTKLTKIFNELTKRCKPASPCTLENTIPNSKLLIWAGPKFIRFIRDIWLTSVAFLTGYVIFGSLSTSNVSLGGEIKNLDLFLQQLQLFFSGGLGACLFALYTSRTHIVKRTFDNKYISHYYTRIIIGVITGFILANIINSAFLQSETGILKDLTPSLIALLGGFSSDAVIRILNRLVAMLTTLVEGETKDIIESREEELKGRYEAQKIRDNMNNVIELRTVLETSNLSKESEAYGKISDVINKLMQVEM